MAVGSPETTWRVRPRRGELWLVELRHLLPVPLVAVALTGAAGAVAALAPDIVALGVVRELAVMLCWSGTAIWAAGVLVRHVTLVDDPLVQLGTRPWWRVAVGKALMIAALLTVQHVVTTIAELQTLHAAFGENLAGAVAHAAIAKVASLAAYLAVVLLVATLATLVLGRMRAVATVAIGVTIVVVGHALLLWRVGAPDTEVFVLGVGSDTWTVHLYANVLPLVLTGPSEGVVPDVAWLSLGLNAAVALTASATWLALARGRRWDRLPR